MRARLTILLLVVFVAVDVLLVALAFRHTSSPASAPGAAAATLPASVAASPSPSASPVQRPRADPPSYLDVGGTDLVLRATAGDCTGSAASVVTVSTDLGGTFHRRPVDGLAQTLRVEVLDDGSMWVIGRTSDCSVARWTSTDSGRSWSRTDGAGGSWYLFPGGTRHAVASPAGRRATPCAPVGLSTIDASVVRVLCSDGPILGTSDGGRTWVALGRLDGAVSIRFTTPGDGIALARQDGCPAAVLQTTDGGTSWTRQTCLDGTDPLAVAAAGTTQAAQVGRRLAVSTDGGGTWSTPTH